MSWSAITIDNVRLTPNEKAKLLSIENGATTGADILSSVVAEFIAAIQAGGNQVANDGTIPDLIRPHVINRTRWLWLLELPSAVESIHSKQREAANTAAEKFLEQLATGHPKVEAPPVSAGTTPLVTMPSVGNPKLKHFRKRNEDGIF
jgi:hypothetical protein